MRVRFSPWAPIKNKKTNLVAGGVLKSKKHVKILAVSFAIELERLVDSFMDEIRRHSHEDFLESSLDAMPRIILMKAVKVSQQIKDRREERRAILINGPEYLEEE